MNKKGQHIMFGSLFAFFVFFLLFTVFFDYVFINPSVASERHERLSTDSIRAAVTLIQSGYPPQWDELNVQRAGIAEDGLLNLTKMTSLDAISTQPNGYERIKGLLGIRYDYLLTINDDEGIDIAIGEPLITTEAQLLATNPDSLASKERLLIHPETRKPVRITVYLYQ